MIAGIIPRADMTAAEPDLREALAEREAAILDRAASLVADAAENPESWLGQVSAADRDAHRDHLVVVATYRDRHGIAESDPRPLGGPPKNGGTARADWRAARAAWRAIVPPPESTRRGPVAEAGPTEPVSVRPAPAL
jgi:hypothetical protein